MKNWIIVCILLLVTGCSQQTELIPVSAEIENSLATKVVDSTGNEIGTAELTETEAGVRIRLLLQGLSPGEKAIHIHEVGSCDKPDFKTAGSHFNPTNKQHGFEDPKGYHAGDLPNLKVTKEGEVDLEITSPSVTLTKGKPNSLLDKDGSSLIIHENADDYITDPSGNSGDRIACAVIK
ncbi:superoxide dismutase family protein [Paenisporosarcina sp. TG20]|uniref:superoxide dismutase family protein n=1 Tax=Paenisporosarcina sp. TG20 TaxID=1211706 RepID=UPI0003072ED8|nr:superoxide dismutase family protein [Paenisporosarcina sp. TG20]